MEADRRATGPAGPRGGTARARRQSGRALLQGPRRLRRPEVRPRRGAEAREPDDAPAADQEGPEHGGADGMIHNRQSTGTSVGATIGTFDPVNTRNGNNLLPSGCTGIYGMTYVGSRVAFTAALSKQTRVRITHPASGFNNDDFLVGALTGAGIATNDQAADIAIAEFIPLQREGQLGGSSVNFFVSDAGQAATDASSVACGPVSYTAQSNLGGAGSPPKEWFDGRVSWPGHALPYQGSVGGAGALTGTAANAGTDLGNSIIRAEYNVICGFRLSMAPKVVGTAGEEAVAWGAQDTAPSSP